eukprot:6253733-Pyramimonas_sp.AAC.1
MSPTLVRTASASPPTEKVHPAPAQASRHIMCIELPGHARPAGVAALRPLPARLPATRGGAQRRQEI